VDVDCRTDDILTDVVQGVLGCWISSLVDFTSGVGDTFAKRIKEKSMLLQHSRNLSTVFIKQMLGDTAVAYLGWVCNSVKASFILGCLVVVSAYKDRKVMHVGQLIWRDQRVGSA
jgi:hypothetical protein